MYHLWPSTPLQTSQSRLKTTIFLPQQLAFVVFFDLGFFSTFATEKNIPSQYPLDG